MSALRRVAAFAAPVRGARTVFAGQDKWRSHPVISNGTKHAFPGLKYSVPLFVAYVVFDKTASALGFGGDDHGHGHDEGHGEWTKGAIGDRPVFSGGADDHDEDDE